MLWKEKYQHHLQLCESMSITNVVILQLFSAGEPKIGVYMLNSGGKKLYVKVRYSL